MSLSSLICPESDLQVKFNNCLLYEFQVSVSFFQPNHLQESTKDDCQSQSFPSLTFFVPLFLNKVKVMGVMIMEVKIMGLMA